MTGPPSGSAISLLPVVLSDREKVRPARCKRLMRRALAANATSVRAHCGSGANATTPATNRSPSPPAPIDTNRDRSTAEALVGEVTQEPVDRLRMHVRGAKNMLAHAGDRSCIRDPTLELHLHRASIADRP